MEQLLDPHDLLLSVAGEDNVLTENNYSMML